MIFQSNHFSKLGTISKVNQNTSYDQCYKYVRLNNATKSNGITLILIFVNWSIILYKVYIYI